MKILSSIFGVVDNILLQLSTCKQGDKLIKMLDFQLFI